MLKCVNGDTIKILFATFGLTNSQICPNTNGIINVDPFLQPCDESVFTTKILEKKYFFNPSNFLY